VVCKGEEEEGAAMTDDQRNTLVDQIEAAVQHLALEHNDSQLEYVCRVLGVSGFEETHEGLPTKEQP